MGKHGQSAIRAPSLVEPAPVATVCRRLASVQFSESIPWLYSDQDLHLKYDFGAYSKSSPSGLDVPVLRACFPSTLSNVEYIHTPAAKLKHNQDGAFIVNNRYPWGLAR